MSRESIDISGYGLEQLQMMREGMTNDIKTLTQNYKQLKQAQGRHVDACAIWYNQRCRFS